MHAAQGDRVVLRGKTVEAPDRHDEIVEVRGLDGEPPYLVRFSEGHESILFPGTDFMIEHIEPR
ncbi:DUF1918 domain-containing protein [Cryobacterium sp. TMT1-62]|uniref:DUF1918 domain-containing protein n=1 Tax=unclassified Cryobacterium TaxID=2649013 RepID=UPI00106CD659|nr:MULTISPECIES: DUF1918 domain-containing protein [unclassified Cryobacterium]TFB56540.1 DUF1918 domain-containing protein [Cryobacterium sp. Sr3]TFC48825.1 DUF1918 domain-containing protein [Cryobacterium sp. TMT2-17-1]TFD33581.1 DUF1918 domain-containing protein [Cryobacterium sp. TMT1-62]